MNKTVKILLLYLVITAFVTAQGNASDKIEVFVSILPQKYFVQQIGKNRVDVKVMVQPGASPATYEPKPRQMAAITKAKVYFSIGVPFEKTWLPKIASSNPDMKVVNTDRGIQKIAMADHHHHGEEHYNQDTGRHQEGKPNESHDDDGILDPHIWLSPPLVSIMARAILTALQEIDPDHRSAYETNYDAFNCEILALNAELTDIFTGKRGTQFMVFHPAWGYFAHTYGLKQIPVEIQGKNPKPAQLKELIKYAQKNDIRIIFVQPQFSAKSAEVIARSIGGQVVFANPLAEDWALNLRDVARKIKDALR
jgi:zinc transport system substrate-binding protein